VAPSFRLPAIRVEQPLGEFFAIAMDAESLRKVTFIDPTRIKTADRQSFFYNLLGAQRPSSSFRARQIAKYIDTQEAAFPNSIILAANYINYGELQEDPEKRWRIERTDGRYTLVVPTLEKMASVIDGQHRLLGFEHCEPERRKMELLCSVFIDLPHAYQAYLFATININQRKVDKSLAYEQFGYNLDQEKSDGWSPDKLAVFMTRRLNLDPASALYRHIRIAPIDQSGQLAEWHNSDWQVSTAAVVEGLVRLISASPKADRDALHKLPIPIRTRARLGTDSSPFRSYFLKERDDDLYKVVKAFFASAANHLWVSATDASYARKTIGIQALFDVLRILGQKVRLDDADLVLRSGSAVDFANPFYQAGGKGRVRIKNTLLLFSGLIVESDLPDADRDGYREIQRRYPVTK
jgi:DNA phosphorothioation-associated DGQHR protein 1